MIDHEVFLGEGGDKDRRLSDELEWFVVPEQVEELTYQGHKLKE